MSEGGDIFSPASGRDLYREAELLTLRQISATLQTMNIELVNHRETLATVREDLAVVKERQATAATLRGEVADIKKEVEDLKARNLRQDGAYTFVTMLKDFGPWLVSLLLLAWGLFTRRAA